jgi:transposase
VSFASFYKWTAALKKGGVGELLRGPNRIACSNRLKLPTDIAKCDILREAACVSKRSVWRLHAIASLLDGKTIVAFADDLGMSKSAISNWGISFNKRGTASLIGKLDLNT